MKTISKSLDLFVVYIKSVFAQSLLGDDMAFIRHCNGCLDTIFNSLICLLPKSGINVLDVLLLLFKVQLKLL